MSLEAEFKEWWAEWPLKLARGAALTAYVKARKKTTADELRAGLHTFLMHLDANPKWWPRATTWLNQERWADSYEITLPEMPREETRADCRHDPPCPSTDWHRVLLMRERKTA